MYPGEVAATPVWVILTPGASVLSALWVGLPTVWAMLTS